MTVFQNWNMDPLHIHVLDTKLKAVLKSSLFKINGYIIIKNENISNYVEI